MTASSHGPRARVGLIVPSSNRQVEQEMLRRFPRDVQPHVTRLRMTGPHHVPLAELLPRVREAAAALDDARCDVVMFHCTATAMEDGPEGEAAVLDALREGARRAVGTTATAIDAALTALAARRIVLVSPYDDRTKQRRHRSSNVPVTRSSPRWRPISTAPTRTVRRRLRFGMRRRSRRRTRGPTRISSVARTSRASRSSSASNASSSAPSSPAIRPFCGTPCAGSATSIRYRSAGSSQAVADKCLRSVALGPLTPRR